MDRSIAAAWRDIRKGILAQRAWRAFALNDVTQRHRRALLGRFWIVATMGITVAAVGSVYAGVMQVPAANYVPFIAAGLVVWHLISSILAESCSTFIGSEGMIKALPVPKTFFVARLIWRNLIIFLINLSVVAVSLAVFTPDRYDGLLFAPIGLLLVLANLCWITVLLGSLAARFRDIAPLTGSAVQVLFLLTPIIYLPGQLASSLSWITYVNPLASLVAVLRDPLLGQWPAPAAILISTAMAVIGSFVGLVVFARTRPLIAVWL